MRVTGGGNWLLLHLVSAAYSIHVVLLYVCVCGAVCACGSVSLYHGQTIHSNRGIATLHLS